MTIYNVAAEIKEQLGRTTLLLLGAKDLGAGVHKVDGVEMPFLGFKIRGSKRVNYIRIILDGGRDLYNVQFIRYSAAAINTVSEFEGIEAGALHELIEAETGLYTYFKVR